MRRPTSTERYLNELIDFGGIPTTRAEAIATMQNEGIPQPFIDRWLQGQEFAARLRAQRERLAVKMIVRESSR